MEVLEKDKAIIETLQKSLISNEAKEFKVKSAMTGFNDFTLYTLSYELKGEERQGYVSLSNKGDLRAFDTEHALLSSLEDSFQSRGKFSRFLQSHSTITGFIAIFITGFICVNWFSLSESDKISIYPDIKSMVLLVYGYYFGSKVPTE